jgi:polysaccharide deacetylase 2 family uncharacterized protein YibQ
MTKKKIAAGNFCLLLLLSLFTTQVSAVDAHSPMPVIAIIIDDLGSDNPRHERVVRLPGAIACSFLPMNNATIRLAKLAHSYNKEILLHLPMESLAKNPMGPGGLSLDMTEQEFVWALQKDLESVPHVSGINNHMGSLLTQHPGHMIWLMEEIKRNGQLFFVDSRTTHASVAMTVALEEGVPSLQRDIFLDHNGDLESVRKQFMKTIARAKKLGTALAIGHPYKNTITVLEEMLPQLDSMGVRLVPVSEMVKHKRERQKTWQAYLSRSQKDVKNSKP